MSARSVLMVRWLRWEVLHLSKGNVLIIADRLKTRKTIIACLKDAGFGVRAIATSEEAVVFTRQANLPFDLAVVDLNIRNGEGIRVLRQLRETNARVLPVAVTRHAAQEVIQEAYRAGALAFVHSLVTLTDLQHFLETLDRIARERQEPAASPACAPTSAS